MRFPLELQLAREWMSDQSDHVRGAALDLIATVAHHGKTMQSGHYTVRCFVAQHFVYTSLHRRHVAGPGRDLLPPLHAQLMSTRNPPLHHVWMDSNNLRLKR